MRKIFTLSACLSVMMLTIANYQQLAPKPGYTLAGDPGMHKCPKGKRWDHRQRMCIGVGR
jgi:hypothetical protein